MTAKIKAPTAADKLRTIEVLGFDIANTARLLQLIEASAAHVIGPLPPEAETALEQAAYLGKMIEAHAAAIYTEIHR